MRPRPLQAVPRREVIVSSSCLLFFCLLSVKGPVMQKSEEDETLDSVMDVNFDYMYKILMVGNSGVGKTAYVSRYCDDHFNPAFISTVGIDFRVKNLIR